ncbi:MAG: nicotinate (nicotinamide) nucleotide adenylyltransferase [Candidatus Marinimicrobia bacterium]|nr:nicotinate (nicotinamide) nucleotide adenylyltransferase [Candidatus Neomarinimicrobiota bacterium]
MMTLCLYGGAFDPVHNGHIHFVERITDTYKPDALFFIPTCYSPFKDKTKYASDEHRLNMLTIASKNIPNSHISTIEIDRKGISYTLDTLKTFHDLYPGHRILWVIGDDHLETLKRWKGYPEHFRYCDFIVLPRTKSDLKERVEAHPYSSQIHILDAAELIVSSTEIREARKEKRSILSYVPDEINDYICTNKLYR